MPPYLKRILFFSFLLFVFLNSNAQNRTKIVYYDANFEISKEKSAEYLVEQYKISDTAWQFSYYYMWGPCRKIVTYKDANGTIMHGSYIVYKKNGYIDTMGYYNNNFPDRDWSVMSGKNIPSSFLQYNKGNLTETKDSSTIYSPASRRIDSLINKDSLKVFAKVQVESEFPGGYDGWLKYIGKNIRYPQKALDKGVKGMVGVQFIVDKEGNVGDESIFCSVEYSLDKEALRIIRNSPRWSPALQSGKPVKSYKKQPIIFGF